jgi:hypothetical protein
VAKKKRRAKEDERNREGVGVEKTKKKKKKGNVNRGNYTILREYIKCILPPLTEVVGPGN